jgi:hypothetical protein
MKISRNAAKALKENKKSAIIEEQAIQTKTNQTITSFKNYLRNVNPTPFNYETELPHREALRARGINFEPYQA